MSKTDEVTREQNGSNGAPVTHEMIKKAKEEMLAKEKELDEARKKVDALQQIAYESAPKKMEKRKSFVRAEEAPALPEGNTVADRAKVIASEESPFSKLGSGHFKKASSKDILEKAKELKNGELKGDKSISIEKGLLETSSGATAKRRSGNKIPPVTEVPAPAPALTAVPPPALEAPAPSPAPPPLEPEKDPNWVGTPRPLSEAVGVGAGKYLEQTTESITMANTRANAQILPQAPEKPKRLSGQSASVRKGEVSAPRLPQPPPKPKRLSGNKNVA